MAARVASLSGVRELHERGRRLANTGRPAESEVTLRRALGLLAKVDDSREKAVATALVLKTMAAADCELRGPDAAFERLDAAGALIRRWHLADLRAGLNSQRGLLFLRMGRLADAVAAFDTAVDDADGSVFDRSVALLNRAVAHMETGARAAARADLELLLRTVDDSVPDGLRTSVIYNLGYVTFLSGDLPAALARMDDAVARDETASAGTSLLGKAQVLVEAGLLREADDTLARACELLAAERMGHDLADAELERSRCAFALGDVRQAATFARRSRDRFRRRGSVAWARAAELVLLQARLANGQARRVQDDAARLCAEFTAAGLRLQARQAALVEAQARLATGDAAGAEAAVGAVPARRDDPITGRLHGRYVQALVDRAAGRPAGPAVRRGLEELARYQVGFGSVDLRTAAAVHGRRLAELDIRLALDDGRVAPLFAAVERARAVSSRMPPVRPPDDPVAADLLAELRQVLDALRTVEQDRDASAPLLRRRRELERQIVGRSWTVAGGGNVARPATLAAVRAELAGRAATMVTYVQAGGELSALVVGRRTALHRLGPADPVVEGVRRVRADLDLLAGTRLPPPVRSTVTRSLRHSLERLDAALLGPVRAAGPLVLVSTGVLGQLPWGSLPSLRGRPIVVAPSATKWLSSAAVGRAGAVRVAALSGPDLLRADAEVHAVAASWPGGVAEEGAGRARLVDGLTTSTVLHIAAHGTHQAENPLFSCLRMADGPVFAHEMGHRAHTPEHVVLSACEVGLATVRPGDEALGLASVLLHLGSRSVVAGVARVDDALAERTMVDYHRRLAGGADSAEALADALASTDAEVPPPFVNFGAAWNGSGTGA